MQDAPLNVVVASLTDLSVNFRAVLAQLNRQIEEYRDQLAKEKKER